MTEITRDSVATAAMRDGAFHPCAFANVAANINACDELCLGSRFCPRYWLARLLGAHLRGPVKRLLLPRQKVEP